MQISPLIPILCLLAGACLVAVSALLHFRWLGLVMVLAITLASAALLLEMRQLPLTAVVLDWRPVTMLGSTASLRIDGTAWLFALALLAAGGSVALTWLVAPEQDRRAPSGSIKALTLAMLAAGLGSVFSANIITMFLCWGLLDGLYSLALLACGGPASGRRAQFALGLNGLATLTVWAVAVLIEQARLSPYWHLLILPANLREWMAVAAALRLGLYPLHIWESAELDCPERTVLVYLIPAMTGLALWARLAVIQGLPDSNVWPAIASVTALVGGILAWVQPDARRSLPYLALGYGGMLILAAMVGKSPVASLATGSASWLLGLTLLSVGRPLARVVWPWAIPTVLGAATLAGFPWTAGFTSRFAFYQGAIGEPPWMLGMAFLAESFLIGALLHWLLTPDLTPLPRGVWPRIGYALALAVPTAPAMVWGVFPSPAGVPVSKLMDTLAWARWGAPLAGAAALTLFARPVRAYLGGWGGAIAEVLRLDRWYSVVLPLLRIPARLGAALGDVLDGNGAFLWMLIFLVVALYLRGS
jgi:formate hydrogenlyase subunit 3/multisubunit Na+/H+ antiporter MnhD subunit